MPITRENIILANRQAYTPRNLPGYFSQVTGGGNLRGTSTLPPAPQVPDVQVGRLELRPPPNGAGGPYRIGIGDVVRLATRVATVSPDAWTGGAASENNRQNYTVRDDGAVTIPEIGSIPLANMTIEEAEASLFRRFVESGLDPAFALEIAGFNSARINVGGAVGSASVIPITLSPPTLAEALTLAGGVRVGDPQFGSIRIYRDGTLYQIPLRDYNRLGELRALTMVAGDSVFVDTGYDLDRALNYYEQQVNLTVLRRADRTQALLELQNEVALRRATLDEARGLFQARTDLGAEERDYVYLAGEVNEQSRFALPYGRQASLADVLYGSGGFSTETGNPAQIYVLRAGVGVEGFGAVTAWHLDASNAVNLTLATQMEMRPDDIIFIEEQPITRWNRALQQLFPPLITAAVGG
ncbi:MAG: polysaccharide biosynthesis/export family protein [Rhodobacteraceae bacterium]|nr:polysaccharide biosynthesis/export family protein [Paracoccaceae bacterium]PHQ71246.1 MAG: sugar transporter [Sneathiella sp.]